MIRPRQTAIFGHCLVLLWISVTGWADEITLPEEAGSSQVELPAISPENRVAEGWDLERSTPDTAFREQTIYIPFNKLREVFEKPGRGVFVPYEQYRQLWEQAKKKIPDPVDHPKPTGALVREAINEASVEDQVVVVAANVRIELLGKGWHKAPLRLSSAAIRSATINDEPARLLFDPSRGYELLIENRTETSREVVVRLEYAKAFSKSAAQHTVSFQPPQAPVNRWRFRVATAGVDVQIHPRIATSENGSDPNSVDETVLTAFVGAAPQVRIDWTPKSEGASGLGALASVQAEQSVDIADGIMRTRARLEYEIRRAEISELRVQVPLRQRVTGVFDPNVRQWKVGQEGSSQIVSVQLFQPAKGRQSLAIDLEQFLEPNTRSINVPTVAAAGVGRQQGIVVVHVAPEFRAEARQRAALSQIDANELPKKLQAREWNFAYRYAAVPFQLELSLEPVTPRILVNQLVEAYLTPEELVLESLFTFDIQKAGVFEVELQIPDGFEVRGVDGRGVTDFAAAAVDAFRRDTETPERLTVDLSRKAEGKVAMVLQLARPLAEPALSNPDAAAANLLVEMPRCLTPSARDAGHLVLYAPESLRAAPRLLNGLKSVPFSEAFASIGSQRGNRFSRTQPLLAYAFQSGSASIQMDAQLRKPQITVRQLLSTRVESGVTKYAATFFYDIRFSGVQVLRIDVPLELSDEIRNVTSGIRETVLDPQPADVAEGYVAWGFGGESEFLGKQTVNLEWDRKSEELPVGGSYEFAVPALRPRDVNRAWGQLVLSKAESIDIQPTGELTGLRSIDPQHDLMAGATATDAIRAFEFHDDWALNVRAKRYELEDVKRTSIERGVIRMVVTRSGRISVQALYRVRSVTQGLVVKLPAGAEFDSDPLRIDGQTQPLKQGEADTVFVPISDKGADSFLLDLRYTVPGSHRRLDLPEFPAQPPVQSEPAIQQVYLTVYLPQETVHLGSFGPWTSLATMDRRRGTAAAMYRDAQQLEWVSAGITLPNKSIHNFSTDGNPYSFTTIRPAPAPDGSLRLVAFSLRIFNLLLFGSVGLMGVAVARRSLQTKVACALIFALAVVAAGIFAPTFASQLVHERLVFALGVVIMIWLIVGAMNLRLPWHARSVEASSMPAVVAVLTGGPPDFSEVKSAQQGTADGDASSEDETEEEVHDDE